MFRPCEGNEAIQTVDYHGIRKISLRKYTSSVKKVLLFEVLLCRSRTSLKTFSED